MTIISTITGLIIAALLSVPSTTQQEAPQVGEELVVEGKKETVKLQDERWFLVDVSAATNPDEPSEQIIQSMYDGNINTPCPGSAEVCAIQLDVSNIDLDDYDFESGTHTIDELNTDGAPFLNDAHKN